MHLVAAVCATPITTIAQAPPSAPPVVLRSTVIAPDSARSVRATATGSSRSIMDTVTATMRRLEAHVTTLGPGSSPHAPHRHPDEELIVVQRGTLDVMQEGIVRRAASGSIIFQASNELHGLRNVGPDTASYLVVRMDPIGAASSEPSSVEAARALLATLTDSGRTAAFLPFDSVGRRAWNYVPMVRTGLPLGAMSPLQRGLVDALLASALGPTGLATARRIVQHESILRALEQAAGRTDYERRDPTRYYTAIFGRPAGDSVWGWRFEGHHLSVNVTEVPGEAAIVAPLFMGANPARVPSGPAAGLRILAAEEDVARELMRMLSPERRRRAIVSDTTYGEILTRNDPRARALKEEGLTAAEMSAEEQRVLRRLIDVYAQRFTPRASRDQLARIERAGFGRLRFVWAGSVEIGKAHYYRIHGPTVLIEYDNTQTDANHIHTVWRDLERDFGGDVLKAHYAKHKH